jgi:hypothetical protein
VVVVEEEEVERPPLRAPCSPRRAGRLCPARRAHRLRPLLLLRPLALPDSTRS